MCAYVIVYKTPWNFGEFRPTASVLHYRVDMDLPEGCEGRGVLLKEVGNIIHVVVRTYSMDTRKSMRAGGNKIGRAHV